MPERTEDLIKRTESHSGGEWESVGASTEDNGILGCVEILKTAADGPIYFNATDTDQDLMALAPRLRRLLIAYRELVLWFANRTEQEVLCNCTFQLKPINQKEVGHYECVAKCEQHCRLEALERGEV